MVCLIGFEVSTAAVLLLQCTVCKDIGFYQQTRVSIQVAYHGYVHACTEVSYRIFAGGKDYACQATSTFSHHAHSYYVLKLFSGGGGGCIPPPLYETLHVVVEQ
jgi:hypothetical protein